MSNTFRKSLSFTLGQRRTHYIYRAAIAAASISDLQDNLSSAKCGKIRECVLALAFTGQGAQ